MIFHETRLYGAYIVEIEKRSDNRGFFARSFCRNEFAKHGLTPDVMQANIGFSRLRGTLRGLHYQLAPHGEAKLVRCVSGSVYDVILDLRPDSPTREQWLGIELNAADYRLVYVPEGCAHGYLVLENNTEVSYQVSRFYTPEAEKGVRWNDPKFNIQWPGTENILVSEKDQNWPDWSG